MAIGYVIAAASAALHMNFVRREVADRHADGAPERREMVVATGSFGFSPRMV
jgi:hypothetical protein